MRTPKSRLREIRSSPFTEVSSRRRACERAPKSRLREVRFRVTEVWGPRSGWKPMIIGIQPVPRPHHRQSGSQEWIDTNDHWYRATSSSRIISSKGRKLGLKQHTSLIANAAKRTRKGCSRGSPSRKNQNTYAARLGLSGNSEYMPRVRL